MLFVKQLVVKTKSDMQNNKKNNIPIVIVYMSSISTLIFVRIVDNRALGRRGEGFIEGRIARKW